MVMLVKLRKLHGGGVRITIGKESQWSAIYKRRPFEGSWRKAHRKPVHQGHVRFSRFLRGDEGGE